MKTEKEIQPEVVLYWDGRGVQQSRDIGTIALSFVEVRVNEAGFDEVRNPQSDDYSGSPYADLQFHAQWNTDRGETYAANCTYAHDCYYSAPYNVKRRRTERMLKMLKKIESATEKFPVHPASFGQYVVLLCQGLGIKRLCVTENSRGWHNENTHTFAPITEAQRKIDCAICDSYPKPQVREEDRQTA